MKVEDILSAKGNQVATVHPDTRVATACRRLREEGIGALVVSGDGARVDGLLSERDIVLALAVHGPALVDMPVSRLMSRNVATCTPRHSIRHLMREMTRLRTRHLPVVDAGRLCGIVSIGDVVKHRLEEVELESNVLRDAYLGTSPVRGA